MCYKIKISLLFREKSRAARHPKRLNSAFAETVIHCMSVKSAAKVRKNSDICKRDVFFRIFICIYQKNVVLLQTYSVEHNLYMYGTDQI